MSCMLFHDVVIFVVLQAHSYRTYQGFTCLIQISTRDHDYIIDALALREHLNVLNDSFTDPRILKVSLSFIVLLHAIFLY